MNWQKYASGEPKKSGLLTPNQKIAGHSLGIAIIRKSLIINNSNFLFLLCAYTFTFFVKIKIILPYLVVGKNKQKQKSRGEKKNGKRSEEDGERER